MSDIFVLEIIRDGFSGFLIEPKDTRSLVEKIRLLATDPHLRKNIGVAGRARVEEKFTADPMVDRSEEIYREVLRKS